MAYRLQLRAPFLSRAACLRRLRLPPPGACLAARMSARACRDAERLSGGSRWVLMPQLRGSLCAATASRSSSSFFPISRLPRISGGRWRYTRGKQTISTSSVAPPTADQPLSDARQFAPCVPKSGFDSCSAAAMPRNAPAILKRRPGFSGTPKRPPLWYLGPETATGTHSHCNL